MSCMESSIHVSGSEAAGSSVKLDAIRFFNAFKRSLQRSYALFRGSRLGLTGLTIVLIFAAIGILAPIISPYPRSYEAPDSDRFTVSSYSRNLTLRGLNYSVPVMGPTTPLQSDRLGGMWLVNYAREGYVFMDFTEHTLETNVSPFQAGNRSLQFHISDLPVSPQPVAPLEALYFVVPALDSTKSTGPRNGNGAIAFFAQRDFYVYDPFTRSLIFRWRLGFDPSWTGEDPASSGELNSSTNFRTGRGQTILLPLANGSLEVHNVDGSLFGWVPLRLAGQPATVTGTIGFTRSTSIDTMKLYLPVRSSSATGVAVLDAASMKIVREFSVPDPTWEPVGIPTSYRAQTVYLGLYDHNEGPDGTTHMIRLNETAVENLQFRTDFPGRVRTFFEVDERSKVFVFPAHGGISMLATTSRTDAHVAPEPFAITPPSNVSLLRSAGPLGGTLYGTALIPQELYGVWTDASEGETTLFQLLGTVRTPLPPGTYPSGNHYVLGTDFRGADILTQLFYGTQVAFIVGGLAAVFAVGLGTLVGLIAGFFGKLVDTLLMRTTDIFLVLPFLPIVLILASILRPSIWVIILVLGIIGWPGIARVIRAQVLTIKERPFVDAARVSGASDLRLIFFQVAPNVLPFSFLYMSLTVAGAIITEAALRFLGLGDASVISWGGMLSQVLTFGGALTAWWWLFPPGLAITLLSLGFYLLGRGFDEIINPRLRRR